MHQLGFLNAAALNSLLLITRRLRRMGQVVKDKLAKIGCCGRHVRVGTFPALVNRQGNVSGRRQFGAGHWTPRKADSVGIPRGEWSSKGHIGATPVRLLDIVTVARIGAILARITTQWFHWLGTLPPQWGTLDIQVCKAKNNLVQIQFISAANQINYCSIGCPPYE